MPRNYPTIKTMTTPNFGPPAAGAVLWRPTEAEAAAIRAGGRITDAARWDNMGIEARMTARPDLNPRARWFEQGAHRTIVFKQHHHAHVRSQ